MNPNNNLNCDIALPTQLGCDGIYVPQLTDECDIGIGCQDYEKLNNLPKINGVELVGDRSSSEIHVQHEMDRITEQQIDNIIY